MQNVPEIAVAMLKEDKRRPKATTPAWAVDRQE